MDNLGLSDLGLTQSLLPWVVDLIGSHGSPGPAVASLSNSPLPPLPAPFSEHVYYLPQEG